MTWQEIIPNHFSDESKIWIYQCNRTLQTQEVIEMDEQLLNFYEQWTSHGAPVKGWAKILFNRFVVVMADEAATGVSGCSTDSMVRIIKSFERQYSIELFDRMTISFLVKDKVEPLPLQQINYALQKGYIETDTPLFNHLVDTKIKLLNEWLVPLNKSWIWSKLVGQKI